MAEQMRDADRPERPTRIDVSIMALLTTSDGHSFPVVIRDISAKGCRFEHGDQVMVGECVSLKVGSEDAMVAEIKWALGREAGGPLLDPVPDVDNDREASRMRIELNCAECGQNRFTITEGMDDDAVVLCAECGHEIGTMAQLKEKVAAEVLKRSKA